MRVLAVSDKVNSLLYSAGVKEVVGDIDLIISCGDLPLYYLDFLVTMLCKPLFYVCGNHDHYDRKGKDDYMPAGFNRFYKDEIEYLYGEPKTGGINMDKRFRQFQNKIFLGMEGSILYNYGDHQYTELQMRRKIVSEIPMLYWNKLTKGRFLDVLITHAPPRGIHDKNDKAHQGFSSYLNFLRRFRPKYLLHGHTHLYDQNELRVAEYEGTKVINCYDYRIIDIE